MLVFGTSPCRVIAATILCFTSLCLEAKVSAAINYAQGTEVRDDSRAEEWRRREILNSHDHSRGNSIEVNANPYLLLVVLPLIGFILLVALIRMNDF